MCNRTETWSLLCDCRHGSISRNKCMECTYSKSMYAFIYALTNLMNMVLATVATLVRARASLPPITLN